MHRAKTLQIELATQGISGHVQRLKGLVQDTKTSKRCASSTNSAT